MTAVPDLTTLAGQRAHYAAVYARLWGPPPPVQWVRYTWRKPVLTEIWSKPVLLEIFENDAATIATILAALGDKPTIREIIIQTALHYGLSEVELLRYDRHPPVTHARMIGMAIARAISGECLHELGRCFYNRDHTTISHAYHKYSALVERAMAMNARARAEVEAATRAMGTEQAQPHP